MPYVRRRRYRRGYRRVYRRSRSSPITYGAIGRKIWSDVNRLKRFVNTEKKYLDVNASSQTMTNTGTLALLNGLALGSSASARLGQSIKMFDLFINGHIAINTASTAVQVQVLVLLDTQANAAAPSITNVFTSAEPTALRLIGTGVRFRILMRRRLTLSINGTESVQFKRRIPLGQHVRYNSLNNGTIADINTNSLYFFYSSDQGVNYPTITYYARMRFIDN